MIKKFKVPIYNRTVIYHHGERDELEISLERHFKSKATANDIADHVSWENLGCVVSSPEMDEIIIHLHRSPNDSNMFGTLAHEIFHVVNNIADRAGLKLTDASDEAYAYLTGYITETIYRELKICTE